MVSLVYAACSIIAPFVFERVFERRLPDTVLVLMSMKSVISIYFSTYPQRQILDSSIISYQVLRSGFLKCFTVTMTFPSFPSSISICIMLIRLTHRSIASSSNEETIQRNPLSEKKKGEKNQFTAQWEKPVNESTAFLEPLVDVSGDGIRGASDCSPLLKGDAFTGRPSFRTLRTQDGERTNEGGPVLIFVIRPSRRGPFADFELN